MTQNTLEAHYRPNWALTQAHGLAAYNCGYAESSGEATFFECQKDLVWRLLGDTEIGPESTILDVGCGIGGPVGWMVERYRPHRAIGLEYLGSSVIAANERYRGKDQRPEFLQGDAHKLPVADASVDCLFNLESALHYEDKDAFLAECHRVLKPGGMLCLGDITTRMKLIFAPMRWLNSLSSQFNCNLHLWSGDEYAAGFKRHGFEVLRHEEASGPIARSLAKGREELKSVGWMASRGFRGRRMLLRVIESQLACGRLTYDLYGARRS